MEKQKHVYFSEMSYPRQAEVVRECTASRTVRKKHLHLFLKANGTCQVNEYGDV